ncbi:MAG TPA: Asp-tRNA(Asn)/Glu-tRNA(Gln) amidotransferase subunit GatB [bacterium]|nr:Asp-tRNA(Asn)/Glu-tRNA(Gln) amidotransferase subunit GatB [bacterium]HPJ71684.1 Asp-tRNA(Asn)/Glu-tRNA(Gln) amidotransferase subunit GatB [bacterium]HPQ65600.1 Asp-tRNA(Asn)/Glu-tRNA(Gln) amidotransferase subunit GatB [bacterium]
MNSWETVIGLEVHVQLKTESKLFCSCPVGWGGEPNSRVCPVCLGLPGVLPVLNRRAVELAVRAGLALNCRTASFSKFDRKNYYYPDLPKAYQISQYDRPLNGPGWIDISVDDADRRIGITRAHLEEDAGKLVHFEDGSGSGVDYNRTGVPLLEIVSEPELRTPREAHEYLKTIHGVMRYAGVSDCDMEKGSFRCDANISLRPAGSRGLGVKVEIKNMNSFKAVEKALEYEERRQRRILDKGGAVVQETRLFVAESGKTRSMRSKEEAHDYRYFPDPDLVPVVLDPAWLEEERKKLPELPAARAQRFAREYGIPAYDAGVLTAERELADYFEAAARLADPKTASNWVMVELLGKLKEAGKGIAESPVSPEGLAELLSLVVRGTISGKTAKAVFAEMFSAGSSASDIVRERGLVQISDAAELEGIVDRVIADNPGPAEEVRSGKDKAIAFLVGQAMKATRGKANPREVNRILKERLGRN